MTSSNRPWVGTIMGDPTGIGPEIIVKSWATGDVHRVSRPIVIGSVEAMRRAVGICGLDIEVRGITDRAQFADSPAVIDVFDEGHLDPGDITVGKDNRACGLATGHWLDQADRLARDGTFEATVMGPVSSVAMKMAGTLDKVVKVVPGETWLMLVSGPLRVTHVTDHMPMREVCDVLSADLIEKSIVKVHDTLTQWGLREPRIGVAGLNAHAMGVEDEQQIRPGVERARARGIRVEGPISPDTAFRQCIDGRYDMILAMYHDQGHIAIKTWGFSGNCVVVLGLPYLHLSVGHGTAHDIAGKGIADHTMMLAAMTAAGSLLGGRGFPPARAAGQ